MTGVAIRLAGPADLPAVLRLLRALAPPGEPAHRFYEDLGFVQHGLSFSVPIARR